MKKWIKVLIVLIATPILLLCGLFIAYVIINSQGVIEPFEHGNPDADKRILIASQGSDFKEVLVKSIIDQAESNQYFFSVIDCTTLGNEIDEKWDVIVIIHTLQVHKMPEEAKVFLSEVKDISKVMLVSTSGAGDDFVEVSDVDAISSASRMSAIPEITKWVNERLLEKL